MTEGKQISDELYNELDNYLKENVIGKNLPMQRMFDASYHVSCENGGCDNYPEIYGDLNNIIKKYQ